MHLFYYSELFSDVIIQGLSCLYCSRRQWALR